MSLKPIGGNKSLRQTLQPRANIAGFLLIDRPITRLSVLRLNSRPISWINDAMMCCRLYLRMQKAEAMAPRVWVLMKRWAGVLMSYAPHYGIQWGGLVSDDSTWPMNSQQMLLHILRDIVFLNSPWGKSIENFEVFTWNKKNSTCPILRKPTPNLVVYRTQFNDFKTEMISSPIGGRAFEVLRFQIQAGLNRHRSQVKRQELISRIKRINSRVN